MQNDVTTSLDLVLVSALCFLTWMLDHIVKRRRPHANEKVEYYITPAGGRMFYWRRSYNREEEHAA